jgi:hypothetical protein
LDENKNAGKKFFFVFNQTLKEKVKKRKAGITANKKIKKVVE